MPTAISNATRIWELNVFWPLYAQCGVWDPKGRGVDIWECIKARMYLACTIFLYLWQMHSWIFRWLVSRHSGWLSMIFIFILSCSTCVWLMNCCWHLQPPNPVYWQYLGRRWSFSLQCSFIVRRGRVVSFIDQNLRVFALALHAVVIQTSTSRHRYDRGDDRMTGHRQVSHTTPGGLESQKMWKNT